METDLSQYTATADSVLAEVAALPETIHQETTVNLANGASIDFDFNIDFNPLVDVFVFADQALTVQVFVRQGSTDTFRQLGNDAVLQANRVENPLSGRRLPGAQARIRLLNASGAATTVLSAQAHVRSL